MFQKGDNSSCCSSYADPEAAVRNRFLRSIRPAALLKKTLAQVFSCEFCEISMNTFFKEHFLDHCFLKSNLCCNKKNGLVKSLSQKLTLVQFPTKVRPWRYKKKPHNLLYYSTFRAPSFQDNFYHNLVH